MSVNMVLEYKQASLEDRNYGQRNVGVGESLGNGMTRSASFLSIRLSRFLPSCLTRAYLHSTFLLALQTSRVKPVTMDSSKTDRDRSRSPRRSPGPRKPKNFSNLKFKGDRERRDPDRRRDDRDRDRERRPRDYSDRDRRRDDDRSRDHRRPRDTSRDRRRDSSRDRRRRSRSRDRKPRDSNRDSKPKEKKSAPAAPAAPSEPMILVTINDRLGTKTQVPCLPSDPIKLLKAMVAAKIGRPVHEIMLKRQGERPFHDNLTCADYAISNGVQIDLELNTGD